MCAPHRPDAAVRSIALLVTATLALAAAPAPQAPAPAAKPAAPADSRPLLLGNWAGDGFALGGGEKRITVQNGCTKGRSAGPVRVNKDGSFSAKGYFDPPHSGYRLGDIAPVDRPAVFSGTITGKTLTLTVFYAGRPTGPAHVLTRDAPIAFPRCD